MYRLSDSDSVDSDKGIRYKTDSIRNKDKSSETDSSNKGGSSSGRRERNRSRSRSPSHRSDKRKKGKRRKREHSSEDDEKGRYSSRSKDRRSDDKRGNDGTRRHRGKEERKRDFEEKKPSGRGPRLEKMESTLYGPALPSRTTEKGISAAEEKNSIPLQSSIEKKVTVEDIQVLGPALPPLEKPETKIIGPTLPPNFVQKPLDDPMVSLHDSENRDTEPCILKEEDRGSTLVSSSELKVNSVIGPTLPADLEEKTPSLESDALIAPALPSDLIQATSDAMDESSPPATPHESIDKTIGPFLPAHLRQKLLEESASFPGEPVEDVESEDEVYGPVPEGGTFSQAHVELEERALQMKMDQLDPAGDQPPGREEWMLTLPQAKAASFGLGPRQFKSKAGPDLSDRSSWTDTPEDKAKKKAGKQEPKVDLQKEAELREIKKRDQEQEMMVKKSKKHKKTLLEMHQKKLNEKKKEESGPSERRPFSREIDLKVNRFDEAQKKAVLKKARLLDTRFSAGESKYL